MMARFLNIKAVSLALLAIALLVVIGGAFDRLHMVIHEYPDYRIGELILTAAFAALVISVFYFRRAGDPSAEIARHERAEALLHETESRFRAVFDYSPHSTYLLDREGRFLIANREFQRRFGLKPEDIAGHDGFDFQPGPVASYYAKANQEVLATNRPFSGVVEQVYPDGTLRANLVVKFPVHDAQGRLIQIGTINTDISEVRRTEAALRESEALFRGTFENAAVGIAQLALDGRLLRVNHKFCDILGYTQDEIGELTIQAITHPDDLDASTDHISRLLSGEAETFNTEKRYLRRDGAVIRADLTVSMVRGSTGEPDYFIAVINDVTDRKMAEDELRDSEERYRRLAEVSPDGILVETDGTVTFVNATMATILGAAGTEDIVGREVFDFVPEEDRDPVFERRREVAEKGALGFRETSFLRLDGSLVEVERAIARITWQGRPSYLLVTRDISERRAADRALRESEAQLRLVTDAMPALIDYVGRDGRVRFANKAFADWFGLDQQAIIGMHVQDIRGEEAYAAIMPQLERVLAGERVSYEGERGFGDDTRYYNATHIPHFDSAGEVQGYFALVLDITERKRAEDEIRTSRERLLNVQKIARLGDWERNLKTEELRYSDETCRIFGIDPAVEMTYDRFIELVHPEDRALIDSCARKALQLRGPVDIDFRIVRSDGAVRVINSQATVLFDEAGNPDRLAGTNLDITERHLAEAELRQSRERLAHAEALAHLGGFERDIASGRVEWSDETYRIMGFAPGAFTPTMDEFAKSVHPDDRARVRDELNATISHATPFESEFRIVRPDGAERFVHIMAEVEFDHSGRALRLRGAIHDITERKRAEEALREAEEQLRQAQKMEAVGQLTGGVAHDFNNLLTVILGNLELLEDRLDDEPLNRQFIDTALRAVRRGSDLTQRLLAFSRRQPLTPAPLDINRLVGGMTELLHRTLGAEIETETIRAAGLWRAMVDAAQLENAILNLALNARDAMPDGGRLTIETANASIDHDYARNHAEVIPGRYVMLAVSDSGAGMTGDVLDRVFEPFFTTKREGHGSGLGLSMVFGFVKQSGGHIKIYSEPDEGTTVKLYLPMTGDAATEADARDGPRAVRGRGETILVVEDDADVRDYVASALTTLGYDVLEAADGQSAIATLENGAAIDMLFTDIVLPGRMNGRMVADEARKRRPGIKVLFTSGYTENAVIHHGRLDQGVELLAKPYTKDALAQRIRSVLGAAPA